MKTIEEAILEFTKSYSGFKIVPASWKCAFESGVEFAQRWIDCNNELPPRKITVLAKHEDGGITLGNYNGRYFHHDYGNPNCEKVTHWRPIELK